MAKLEVPDKGRAWVIAISACIINMILSGLSRMIGILYVAVLEEYHVTRQEATLPFTVRNAIRCLAGPIVGVIGQRYGIRMVTFIGGVMACSGASLCCIAPNIAWLAVLWGGLHGLGFAFANTLFQVVVNQYFKKYRATASGIALSGACVGSLGFPFMIEAILDEYGLSGGFLIMGGIVMHVLPPALLLNSPPWVVDPEKYERQRLRLQKCADSVETLEEELEDELTEEEQDRKTFQYVRSTSFSNCPVEQLEVCSVSKLRLNKQRSDEFVHPTEALANGLKEKDDGTVVITEYKAKGSPPLCRQMNGQNECTENINNQNIPTVIYTIDSEITHKAPEQNDHVDPDNSTKAKTGAPEVPSLMDSLRSIAKLYTNPVYVHICICMSTYIIIFIPILTVLVDYSKDKGIPETSGKYLINAMAFGDLVGRLGFGWVTDRNYMSIPTFMTLTMVLEGVFIALFPYAQNLGVFMTLLALYGMTAGSILVHFPILVLKYVDENAQSVAMGCVGFLSGMVSFGIPFLIGHFRDHVGSYDGMFYVTGMISFVTGGMWLFEPMLARIYYRKKEKDEKKQQEATKAIDDKRPKF